MFGLHLFKLGKHGTKISNTSMKSKSIVSASHASPKVFTQKPIKATPATKQYFYPSQAGSNQRKGKRL